MKLAEKYQKQIAAARAEIAASLDATVRASGSLEKMIADEAALNAHIEKLTTDADYADTSKASDLSTCQSQIGMLRRKIESAEVAAQPQLDALKGTLAGLRDVMQGAMQDECAALQHEIATQLLPLYGKWADAHWLARTMPRMASFVSFYLLRSYGERVDVMAEARELLGILDALIAGGHAWNFPVEAAPKSA